MWPIEEERHEDEVSEDIVSSESISGDEDLDMESTATGSGSAQEEISDSDNDDASSTVPSAIGSEADVEDKLESTSDIDVELWDQELASKSCEFHF